MEPRSAGNRSSTALPRVEQTFAGTTLGVGIRQWGAVFERYLRGLESVADVGRRDTLIKGLADR